MSYLHKDEPEEHLNRYSLQDELEAGKAYDEYFKKYNEYKNKAKKDGISVWDIEPEISKIKFVKDYIIKKYENLPNRNGRPLSAQRSRGVGGSKKSKKSKKLKKVKKSKKANKSKKSKK